MQLQCKQSLLKYIDKENLFSEAMAFTGTIYRSLQNRKTLAFTLGEESFFVKQHFGVGYGELIKNGLALRTTIVDASNEWSAIQKLTAAGVRTPEAVAYGVKGVNPATRHSFIITRALNESVELDAYCKNWAQFTFSRKKVLIQIVADMVSTMHGIGIVHRDCYLCHFLLECKSIDSSKPVITLIDLHRALEKPHSLNRWIIKDLASLFFSSLHYGFNQRVFFRFLKQYSKGDSLRQILAKKQFLSAIIKRSDQLMIKYHRKFNEQALESTGMNILSPQSVNTIKSTVDLPRALLLSGEGFVFLEKLERRIKGKRLVFSGKFKNRKVIVKLYYHSYKSKMHFSRELAGIELLNKNKIPTPKCLYHGKTVFSNWYVTVFEFIEANSFELTEVPKKILPQIAKMHHRDLMQADIHPDNFLLTPETCYSIDGADIQIVDNEVDKKNNLALFFSQLDLAEIDDFEAYYQTYCEHRAELDTNYNKKREAYLSFYVVLQTVYQKRLIDITQKSLRTCSAFKRRTTISEDLIYRKSGDKEKIKTWVANIDDVFTADFEKILKKGNSATVVQSEGLVFKRYNIKNFTHFLKKQFSTSRAFNSWEKSYLIHLLRLPVAQPTFALKRKIFGLMTQSYFVCDAVDGKPLDEFLLFATCEEKNRVFRQVRELLSKYSFAQIIHGDFKATNFLVTKSSVVLIDLDSMHYEKDKVLFQKKFKMDCQRFLANWENKPEILALAKHAVDELF